MASGRGHAESIAAAAVIAPLALVHVGHGERIEDFKSRAASLGSESRKPARMAVEHSQLGAAYVVVMQDRLGRAGDDAEVMAFQHRFGEIAPVG